MLNLSISADESFLSMMNDHSVFGENELNLNITIGVSFLYIFGHLIDEHLDFGKELDKGTIVRVNVAGVIILVVIDNVR